MSSLSDKYEKILYDIESHISNEKERNYTTKKIGEMSSIYMEVFDKITKLDETRIESLEKQQQKMEATLSKVKETVDLIKSDIYEDDGYDFEIVCPYCNHEFVADVEEELKEEIECPECHNIIELDWDNEEDNNNHCSSCDNENCPSWNNENNKEDKYNEAKDNGETIDINNNNENSNNNDYNKKQNNKYNQDNEDDM